MMNERIEKAIKCVYRFWKRGVPPHGEHPDDETLALFVDGRLGGQESGRVRTHLLKCSGCAELAAAGLRPCGEDDLPGAAPAAAAAELVLRLKDKAIELLRSTGDVIVGQELIPAAVLRSRKIETFNEVLAVLQDFEQVRVEVRVSSAGAAGFTARVAVSDVKTGKPRTGMRIALLQAGRELESYAARNGSALFEKLPAGNYELRVVIGSVIAARLTLDVCA